MLVLTSCNNNQKSEPTTAEKGTLNWQNTTKAEQTKATEAEIITKKDDNGEIETIALPSGNKTTFKNNGVSFDYPESWETQNTSTGIVVISAPKDDQYENIKISYFANVDKTYDIEDYAGLPQAISTDIGKTYLSISDLKEDELTVTLNVTDMQFLKIDGIDVIYYKMLCNLKPRTQRVIKALPGTSGLYMHCYTFNKNGIDITIVVSSLITQDDLLTILNNSVKESISLQS